MNDFYLNYTVVRKIILYYFSPLKFVETFSGPIYSQIVNVLGVLEKNIYSAVTGHRILHVYIKYINHVQIIYICTDFSLVLLIIERGIFKSPSMIMNMYISPFSSVNFYFILRLCY